MSFKPYGSIRTGSYRFEPLAACIVVSGTYESGGNAPSFDFHRDDGVPYVQGVCLYGISDVSRDSVHDCLEAFPFGIMFNVHLNVF